MLLTPSFTCWTCKSVKGRSDSFHHLDLWEHESTLLLSEKSVRLIALYTQSENKLHQLVSWKVFHMLWESEENAKSISTWMLVYIKGLNGLLIESNFFPSGTPIFVEELLIAQNWMNLKRHVLGGSLVVGKKILPHYCAKKLKEFPKIN